MEILENSSSHLYQVFIFASTLVKYAERKCFMMTCCTVNLNFQYLTLTTQKIQYFFADKFQTFGSDTMIWGTI